MKIMANHVLVHPSKNTIFTSVSQQFLLLYKGVLLHYILIISKSITWLPYNVAHHSYLTCLNRNLVQLGRMSSTSLVHTESNLLLIWNISIIKEQEQYVMIKKKNKFDRKHWKNNTHKSQDVIMSWTCLTMFFFAVDGDIMLQETPWTGLRLSILWSSSCKYILNKISSI